MDVITALIILVGLLAVIFFGWLMWMSLEQKNHKDDWP